LDKFKVEHVNLMYKDFNLVNKTISEMQSFMQKIKSELETNDQLLEDRILENANKIGDYNKKVLQPKILIEEKVDNHSDKLSEIELKLHNNGNIIRDIIKKLI